MRFALPVLRICLIFLLVCAVLTPARAQRRPLGQARQVTYSINADPSLSPDGKQFVYLIVLAGREQLFTANSDGTGGRQITTDDADHEDPAWSPDGTRIAFVRIRGESKRIALIRADGSGLEVLTPDSIGTIHPSWSADSRRLIFCTDDDLAPPRKNPADIVELDIATQRLTVVITGGVNTYPMWSPDGKRIAFRRMLGEMNSEVFVANSDGSAAHNLTNHPAFDGWPAWSPDGSEIAFGSNRNANYQIFIMKADGSNVRLVANTEGRATAPQWSRDGKQIFFTICKQGDFGTSCEIYAAAR